MASFKQILALIHIWDGSPAALVQQHAQYKLIITRRSTA